MKIILTQADVSKILKEYALETISDPQGISFHFSHLTVDMVANGTVLKKNGLLATIIVDDELPEGL